MILFNYVLDARLPWPDEMIGNNASATLARIRQARNEQLERDCEQQVSHARLVVRRRIKPHKARSIGLVSLSGEIDLLVFDPSWDCIWVIEVKDPHFPYSPRSLNRQIRHFHSAGGYVEKLRTKVVDVSRDSSEVARRLGVNSPERQWDVRGMMTTRRVTPAAFVSCEDTMFCTVSQVRDIVVGRRGCGSNRTQE